MTRAIPILLIATAACGPGAAPIELARSDRFAAAQAVFQTACAQCHADFARLTEGEWQTSGRVIAGDASQSPLFRFLKGSGVGGPETMPRDGELSASQREQVRAWIDGLGAVASSPRFHAARVVLANHCLACHREGTGLPSFALPTEDAWVRSGFIVPGDPDRSHLVRRTRGAALGGPAETMPFDRPALRADELNTLRIWIGAMPVAD
jgi:mono/diheme cytochrome c family protein